MLGSFYPDTIEEVDKSWWWRRGFNASSSPSAAAAAVSVCRQSSKLLVAVCISTTTPLLCPQTGTSWGLRGRARWMEGDEERFEWSFLGTARRMERDEDRFTICWEDDRERRESSKCNINEYHAGFRQGAYTLTTQWDKGSATIWPLWQRPSYF